MNAMNHGNAPVWVIADQEKGNLLPVTPQLVGKARGLAHELETTVDVVLLGDGIEAHARSLIAAGAARIFMGNDPELANYHPEVYSGVIVKLAHEYQPQIILMGSTSVGRELAPLVAARLGTGLTAHCIDLGINQDGILDQIIPAYGGEITIVCPERRPQMATIAQGVFPAPELDRERGGEVVSIAGPFQSSGRMETLEVVIEQPEGIPLGTASVVVAGGAGAGDETGWNEIVQLSTILKAGLGCTRPAVDEGWADLESMIGQSGKMVSPDIYLGIGLSGEQQHMVGITGAKVMIAINNDKKSPVFSQVDYGVVEDCRSFLRVLLEKIREYKEQKANN